MCPDWSEFDDHEAASAFQPLDDYLDEQDKKSFGADFHKQGRSKHEVQQAQQKQLTPEQRCLIEANRLQAILRRADYWRRVG